MAKGWDKSPQEERDAKQRESRKAGRKTSTRQWCKGKVGVEHEPEIAKAGYFARFDCKEMTHKVRKRLSEGGSGHNVSWREMEPDDYREVTSWQCYHVEVCARCGKILHDSNRDETNFPCPDRNPSN